VKTPKLPNGERAAALIDQVELESELNILQMVFAA
jgi:hypothetical protein